MNVSGSIHFEDIAGDAVATVQDHSVLTRPANDDRVIGSSGLKDLKLSVVDPVSETDDVPWLGGIQGGPQAVPIGDGPNYGSGGVAGNVARSACQGQDLIHSIGICCVQLYIVSRCRTEVENAAGELGDYVPARDCFGVNAEEWQAGFPGDGPGNTVADSYAGIEVSVSANGKLNSKSRNRGPVEDRCSRLQHVAWERCTECRGRKEKCEKNADFYDHVYSFVFYEQPIDPRYDSLHQGRGGRNRVRHKVLHSPHDGALL